MRSTAVFPLQHPAAAVGLLPAQQQMPAAVPLVLAGFAVVGVFIEIPFVSDYAFWIAIAAYVILAATIG